MYSGRHWGLSEQLNGSVCEDHWNILQIDRIIAVADVRSLLRSLEGWLTDIQGFEMWL